MPMLWFLLACRAPVAGDVLVKDEARSEVASSAIVFSRVSADASSQQAMIIDGDGLTLWERTVEGKVLRIRQSGDDVLVAIDTARGVPGSIRRETLDGELLESIDAPDVHHDVLELADGKVVWLEHVRGRSDLPIEADAPIATDAVMIADATGARVAFDFFTDYAEPPWWVCEHMQKGQRIPGHYQWTHSNSLVADPLDPGRLFVTSRNLDAILHIDLATGEVIDQIGGLYATISGPPETQLDHPHMSNAPAPGRLLVFDNRLHSREPSRIVELAVDAEAGTTELVWSYTHPEIGNIGFLGDAQRLPGGNTLIAWSDANRITEVTPEGDIVWEIALDGLKHIGRVELWSGEL